MEQALKEKEKDNKRLRDNFDTLKSANDTLKKQVYPECLFLMCVL